MLNRLRTRLVLSVVCVLGLGCGRAEPTPLPSAKAEKAEPLRIAAAADLQRVLPALIEKYKAHDADVVLTFGASGQLAEQIRKGAPFDVFLSANMKFVEGLETEGVVAAGSVKPYARGSLVLAVHRAASDDVDGIADLVKPKVRKIAIANPKFAPYGTAANQALERAGLGGSLGPKLVLAESVRQAFLYVEQGDAEAALVSRSLIVDGGSLKVIEVDPGLYDPLIQGFGVVALSDKLDRARRFADFVVGEAGQSILGAHGFRTPGEKAEAPAAREGAPHGG
ncbi:MAG: molybdate ABC transporter substrate-binding protein [Paludisphaera borealis]|uniref:molybdate ABC transporter substrate-binding protein n=1 Tax=Paludisphaera borealis TaxID=1387353 RepID=UPI002844EE3C|nr:molybdate ABC transporter substrate-binding protein [Paludisphaera borealis]MDR3622519.1 molybdate ABC transporter substrate-binding protein [Paludisphaera borealis]